MSGKLEYASDTIRRADSLLRLGAPWALGDAYRLMGDVHLARGEMEQAERCFLQAYQQGGDPYPGYAELLTQRGQGDEAIRGLERTAAQTHWVAGERRGNYLAHAARIAAAMGNSEKARSLLQELDAEPRMWESGAVAGQINFARAELAVSEGNTDEALQLLHHALEILQHTGAVMEAARVHLRLAELLSRQGDQNAVNMELSAAEGMFQPAGAGGYLALCRALREVQSTRNTG
jgi:tetratricopeptide (TPR) repeat protein